MPANGRRALILRLKFNVTEKGCAHKRTWCSCNYFYIPKNAHKICKILYILYVCGGI